MPVENSRSTGLYRVTTRYELVDLLFFSRDRQCRQFAAPLTVLWQPHHEWTSRIRSFCFKQKSIFTLVCTLRAHAEEGSRKGHVCKSLCLCVCVCVCAACMPMCESLLLSELSDQAHHHIICYTKHIRWTASECPCVCMDGCACVCALVWVGVFWRNCLYKILMVNVREQDGLHAAS